MDRRAAALKAWETIRSRNGLTAHSRKPSRKLDPETKARRAREREEARRARLAAKEAAKRRRAKFRADAAKRRRWGKFLNAAF